jgi:hypothetical protein
VCRRAVNLLTLPLNLVDFFVKHSEPSLEPIAVARTLTVELGVVAPGGGTTLNFLLGRPQVILLASVPFSGCLVGFSGQSSHSGNLCLGCSGDLFIASAARVTLPHHENFLAAIGVGSQ